jgi:prepilin-type N-terminal cleavage/methylation domain-containing protein
MKDSRFEPAKNSASQRGMSLVELMIAITVLAVGLGALMGIFSTSIMLNQRAKGDTNGTMVAQAVLERIAGQPATSNAILTLTDCTAGGGVVWNIATAAAAAPGNGAALDANTGGIDFTQAYAAVPNNYKMLYVACGAGGRQTTYDVRWNVQTITGSANTRMITVSARPQAMATAGGRNQALLYAQPITLRTIGGL